MRIDGGHYEALIDGEWREVPPHTILKRADNPTGQAVVCYPSRHPCPHAWAPARAHRR